ncbi:hypothetical protein Tco_0621453, partial [Tanacetum coccineum]
NNVNKAGKSSDNVVEDGESEMEDVYDETAIFIMASKHMKSENGIEYERLYERWKDTDEIIHS